MVNHIKSRKLDDIHLWFYVILTLLCVLTTLVWQSLCYCYWKFIFILAIEVHSAPAFAVIYLCLIAIYIIGRGPSPSLCIVFDFIGFLIFFVVAILQLWAFCAQFDVMDRYRRTLKNNLLELDEEIGSCELNYTFILNLLISCVIFIDMLLFLVTSGTIEEAEQRPHNIGDNMLDAFQDYHFWCKLTGFLMMLFATLTYVLAPYQCTSRALWFKLVQIHASAAFLYIFFCLILIYPFGEYPSTFFCLILDLIGAIVIGFVGFIQLYETYFKLHSSQRKCYFNVTAILNWMIAVVLLLDAAIYIVVEIAMGIERQRRTYDD